MSSERELAFVAPGICPTCGTDLDHDEMRFGNGWFEAFCCVCSRYIRKRAKIARKALADRSYEGEAYETFQDFLDNEGGHL